MGPGLARRTERCALTVGAEPPPPPVSFQTTARGHRRRRRQHVSMGGCYEGHCTHHDVFVTPHTHIRRRRTRTHQIQTNHTHKYKEPFKLCALWFGRENTVCVCVFFSAGDGRRDERLTHTFAHRRGMSTTTRPRAAFVHFLCVRACSFVCVTSSRGCPLLRTEKDVGRNEYGMGGSIEFRGNFAALRIYYIGWCNLTICWRNCINGYRIAVVRIIFRYTTVSINSHGHGSMLYFTN